MNGETTVVKPVFTRPQIKQFLKAALDSVSRVFTVDDRSPISMLSRKIRRDGNSYVITVDKKMLDALHNPVDVSIFCVDGALIIVPENCEDLIGGEISNDKMNLEKVSPEVVKMIEEAVRSVLSQRDTIESASRKTEETDAGNA